MKSRKSFSINSVGSTWVELSTIGWPRKFIITRARAEIQSGSGTTVALSIRERSGTSDVEYIPLEYELVSDLDYLEQALVIPHKPRDIDKSTIYIAVKCNSGTNSVRVTLEYEV